MNSIALMMVMHSLGTAPNAGSPRYDFGNDYVFFDIDNFHDRATRREPRKFWNSMRVKVKTIHPDEGKPFDTKSIDFVGGSKISLTCFQAGRLEHCDFYAHDNGGTERVYPAEGRIEFVYTGATALSLNATLRPNAGKKHFLWFSSDRRTKIESTTERFEFTILPEGRTFPEKDLGTSASSWPRSGR